MPTLLELAGAPAPAPSEFDGVSFTGLIADPNKEVRDSLLLEIGYSRAIVTHDWKYIAVRFPANLAPPSPDNDTTLVGNNREQRKRHAMLHPAYFNLDQLYDLRADPK